MARTGRPKTDIDDKLRELSKKEMTIPEMAEVLGCSRSHVSKRLNSLGLRAPVYNERLRVTRMTKAKMEEALEFCLTVSDLAQHFQVHASTVRVFLKEYGLQPKHTKAYHSHNGSEDSEAEIGFANATMARRDLSTPIVEYKGKRYRDITNLITE